MKSSQHFELGILLINVLLDGVAVLLGLVSLCLIDILTKVLQKCIDYF